VTKVILTAIPPESKWVEITASGVWDALPCKRHSSRLGNWYFNTRDGGQEVHIEVRCPGYAVFRQTMSFDGVGGVYHSIEMIPDDPPVVTERWPARTGKRAIQL